MQSMLNEGVRALAADAGAIELLEGPDWVVCYQCGLVAADVGRRLSRNEAPNATRATLYREPFATADMQAAATDVGLASEHALRSVLAVPLLTQEAVTGCLLFHGKGVRVFSDAEIDFGRTLGAIVSLAVENARLREELRRAVAAEAE
jgi:transcriptional regulator with GAF, ATPase, and Fis domain